MIASLTGLAFSAGWAFFAYGPQLVVCLAFAYYAARRAQGDLLNWMGVGFLWSLVPFAGVAAMWWLWHTAERRRPAHPRDAAGSGDAAGQAGAAGPAAAASPADAAGPAAGS